MTFILGIDEAGRGSVIGPLVIAGAVFNEKDVPKLIEIGVKDSKRLSPSKRNKLFKKIIEIAKSYEIIEISPAEIDSYVDSDNTNLNWLEADKTVALINNLNPNTAIIDCPSPNLRAYKEYLLERIINKKINLVVEHKADLNHVECGAASILAKVTRDKVIKEISKQYGDVGPGYPSNPITQKFLKENWEKDLSIFRKSWSTWKNHKNNKDQSKLDNF